MLDDWGRIFSSLYCLTILNLMANKMNSAIVTSKSKKDLKLLLDLARKLDIKTKLLTKEEIEDLGLAKAISVSRTQKYVDADKFLKKISQNFH